MFEILEDKRSPKPTHNQSAESVRHDISATSSSEDADESDLSGETSEDQGPREIIPGFLELKADAEAATAANSESSLSDAILASQGKGNYVAYTIKLPADQLAALQSIWLEIKLAMLMLQQQHPTDPRFAIRMVSTTPLLKTSDASGEPSVLVMSIFTPPLPPFQSSRLSPLESGL